MQWRILKSYLTFTLLALALLAGCEQIKVQPDHSRNGYDFYPISMGDFRIYQVYRINYNFVSQNDTLEYEQKELIADQYLNQEGDTTYILQQFSRIDPQNTWKLDSTIHIRRTPRQAVELSNNQNKIKLVFPLEEGKTWNSNQLNAADADSFRMVEVFKPFLLSDSLYENTLTVMQRHILDTIVRQDIRMEVFAQNIGPLYRMQKTLNYCATEECIGMGIINSGIYREMKLKSYGRQ